MVVESVDTHLKRVTNPITVLNINTDIRIWRYKEIKKILNIIVSKYLYLSSILLTGDFLCFFDIVKILS